MPTLFISAFVLGLIFNAAPGAVFAETVSQGMRGGFRPALAVQLGSLVGDGVWAVVGLAATGLALQVDVLRWPVGLAGAAYLLWLSWQSWKAAKMEYPVHTRPGSSGKQALRKGMLLSLTNPQNIAYWAAVGSALGGLGFTHPSAVDYGVFFTGFMVSSVLWSFFCAVAVDRLFRRAGKRWASFTYRLCATVLLAMALGILRDLFWPTQPDTHLQHKPIPVQH